MRLAVLRVVAGMSLAAALVVAVEGQAAEGAFTGATSADGNQVGSAADFCLTPGSQSMPATADTWINQQSATPALVTESRLHVVSRMSGTTSTNARALMRFGLPTIPSGCFLATARLRLYNATPVGGRTIDVHLIDPNAPTWDETTVTWATRPPVVAGSAVSSVTPTVAAWQEWNVTASVRQLYGGANNGFMVRDSVENHYNPDGTGIEQLYVSRDATTGSTPVLVVTWD